MFFSVARLRLPLLALAFFQISSTQARERSLFTSSVSYCAPPESLLVQQFDIAYIEKNSSVSFNVSIASVIRNTNVTANLLVNVYGMQPLNLTLELCSVFGGALCPLPTYNFTGSDSITLPPSVRDQVTSKIPGIAYQIPDLEAFAQLTLTDSSSGKLRACIQSTLSNGWSARQMAVEWSTGGIGLLAFLSAVWHSYIPHSLAPIRLLDVMFLFQAIAVSGLWSLNYPLVYQAFTQNFSWALGLFPVSNDSPMQRSIDHMRQLTGGKFENAGGGSAISLVNRRISPYNQPAARSFIARAVDGATAADVPQTASNSSLAGSNFLVGGDVVTVTQNSPNVLQAGLPIYVTSVGIDTPNAFMTIFLTNLIILVICVAALGLGYLCLLALRRTSWAKQREDKLDSAIAAYPTFARAWGLRIVLIILTPVLVFTFYQWTLKDSWLSILLSVILLLAIAAALGFALYTLYRRRSDPDISSHHSSIEPLVAPYRPQRFYYGSIVLLAMFVKALVTAFAKGQGKVQAILILVVEGLFFGVLVVMKPHRTRGADVFAGYLSLTRTACTGLTIAFSQSLALAPIPRVVIGIVIAVIFSISVVVMFLNIVYNLVLWIWARGRSRKEGTTVLPSRASSSAASVENGQDKKDEEKLPTASVTPASSSHFYARPGNPAPSHTPTTASWRSPPLSAVSQMSERPSQYSGTTASSTLGETLPRRWSFQHSRPPSGSVESSHATLSYVTSTSTHYHFLL
ncbi:unnamed protein product [Somion occarium]|uniref:ML-like domain-containing protein n=1 Tax=Somion occarium TaxID=3059160 RepID=A0ABP1DGK1_9APHY